MKMIWESGEFHKMLDCCAKQEWRVVFGKKRAKPEEITAIRNSIMAALLITQTCIGSA